jgi:hypothetical protein
MIAKLTPNERTKAMKGLKKWRIARRGAAI